jgi:hypothetical protein
MGLKVLSLTGKLMISSSMCDLVLQYLALYLINFV